MTTTHEHDELAIVIEQALQVLGSDAVVRPGLRALHATARILRAGYRKPRVIETAAELDALPVGSILLDGGRTPIRKEADGLWHWGEMPLTPGLILPCNPDGLIVLHEGAA